MFGELVPKALTLDRAETLAVLVARPIELIARVLRPVVWVLAALGGRACCARSASARSSPATRSARPRSCARSSTRPRTSGVIPRAQEELLHNVFDFADREARDIMVPAADVGWLDAGLDPDAALDRALENPHSALPGRRAASLDRVDGVVARRATSSPRARRPRQRDASRELARPALVVPETKDLGALLRELREQRQQLAVVVDEYGTIAGIVTLEDVLEELVGEIEDEFDLPDARIELARRPHACGSPAR